MAEKNKDTMFCTPAFGLFGTMIDLGVDLAPLRARIQECKLKYHRELWKIICERGMSDNEQCKKYGGSEDGGVGGGDDPPAEGGGEGDVEANQSNMTAWRNKNSKLFPQGGPPGGPPLGGGGTLMGLGVEQGGRTDGRFHRPGAQSSLRSDTDNRSVAAAAAAAAASTAAAAAAAVAAATSGATTRVMTSAADSTAAASMLFHQQQQLQNRYIGAQLANSGRRAAQLSFSRAKAQLPNITPKPSIACTSNHGTSRHRSSNGQRPHGRSAGGDSPTFVPLHCGNWGEPRTSKMESGKQQKHAPKEQLRSQTQQQAMQLMLQQAATQKSHKSLRSEGHRRGLPGVHLTNITRQPKP